MHKARHLKKASMLTVRSTEVPVFLRLNLPPLWALRYWFPPSQAKIDRKLLNKQPHIWLMYSDDGISCGLGNIPSHDFNSIENSAITWLYLKSAATPSDSACFLNNFWRNYATKLKISAPKYIDRDLSISGTILFFLNFFIIKKSSSIKSSQR